MSKNKVINVNFRGETEGRGTEEESPCRELPSLFGVELRRGPGSTPQDELGHPEAARTQAILELILTGVDLDNLRKRIRELETMVMDLDHTGLTLDQKRNEARQMSLTSLTQRLICFEDPEAHPAEVKALLQVIREKMQ